MVTLLPLTTPLLSQAIVRTIYRDSLSCSPTPINVYSYTYLGLYVLLFGVLAFSVTITFLVITVYFLKRHTIPDAKVKKATVKFGFFLLFGNGLSIFGQLVPASLSVFAMTPEQGSSRSTARPELIYTGYVLMNIALIPTTILILIFFKPIRKRLWHMLCCCLPNKRIGKYSLEGAK